MIVLLFYSKKINAQKLIIIQGLAVKAESKLGHSTELIIGDWLQAFVYWHCSYQLIKLSDAIMVVEN